MRRVVFGALLILLCRSPVFGQEGKVDPSPEDSRTGQAALATYDIPQEVVGAGGHSSASASYTMRGTVGQTFIGPVEGVSFDERAGYWYNPATIVTGIADEGDRVPVPFALEQNWPNPFNPSTTIRFSIPHAERVTIRIYDVSGRLVETLLDKQMTMGVHDVVWDASQQASGVYFSRLDAPGFSQTRKLVLLK